MRTGSRKRAGQSENVYGGNPRRVRMEGGRNGRNAGSRRKRYADFSGVASGVAEPVPASRFQVVGRPCRDDGCGDRLLHGILACADAGPGDRGRRARLRSASGGRRAVRRTCRPHRSGERGRRASDAEECKRHWVRNLCNRDRDRHLDHRCHRRFGRTAVGSQCHLEGSGERRPRPMAFPENASSEPRGHPRYRLLAAGVARNQHGVGGIQRLS